MPSSFHWLVVASTLSKTRKRQIKRADLKGWARLWNTLNYLINTLHVRFDRHWIFESLLHELIKVTAIYNIIYTFIIYSYIILRTVKNVYFKHFHICPTPKYTLLLGTGYKNQWKRAAEADEGTRGGLQRGIVVLSLVISQKHARSSSPCDASIILHLIQHKKYNGKCSLLSGFIRLLNSHFIEDIRFVTLTTSTTANESWKWFLMLSLVIRFGYAVNTINNRHILTHIHMYKETFVDIGLCLKLIKTELNWIESTLKR